MSQKNELISEYKSQFFENNIGDILRAMDGNSILGAFILTLCSIGALSSLYSVTDIAFRTYSDKRKFEVWIDTWMRRFDSPQTLLYPAGYLYAVRCALVHTYGGAAALDRIEIPAYTLTFDCPTLHMLHQISNGKVVCHIVNLECLLADFITGAWDFWSTLEVQQSLQSDFSSECKMLIAEIDRPVNPTIKVSKAGRRFGDIHFALSTFDSNNPEYKVLKAGIHSIYTKNGKCKCNYSNSVSV